MQRLDIAVQQSDFDLSKEYESVREVAGDPGAIVTFTGLVREFYTEDSTDSIQALTLEHYPGMTEKSLLRIAEQADAKWPLLAIRIVHRVGELKPGDQIVLVATASAHRQAAFESAQFIMDYLKSNAPFWKKQKTDKSTDWVQARQTDADAIKRWSN